MPVSIGHKRFDEYPSGPLKELRQYSSRVPRTLRRRNLRTFGFPLAVRLAILAAILAAVSALTWPAVSSLWSDPGKEPRQVELSLPTLGPTTQPTYPVCNVLPQTQPDAPLVIQNFGPCIPPTTAVCRDGTKVHIVIGQVGCSSHGGVAEVSA